jgi:hypothetical protein
MPSTCCVVQDCSNESNATAGISLHISPKNKTARPNWVRFVRTKRANFNPPDETRFMVCSEHFSADSFQRAYHIQGVTRRLNLGAIPTVWKAKFSDEDEFSPRQRRKVSRCTLYSCTINKYTKFMYLIYFYFTAKIIKDILQEDTKSENSLENSDITVSQKTAI